MRVVGFRPLERELKLHPGGAIPLEGRVEILPGERRCIGRTGRGQLCGRPVENSPHCDRHRPWDPCAACRGTCLKEEMTCDRPHVLYLALFAPDTLKVGVTRRERLRRRLREQGADAGRVLAIFPDGRSAREAESCSPRSDRVRVERKVESVHREPDLDALGEPDVELDYFDTELDGRPIRLGPGEPVVGEVLGVKGRVAVLSSDSGLHAVDLRDLLGYGLSGETAPVQSSLKKFVRRGTR